MLSEIHFFGVNVINNSTHYRNNAGNNEESTCGLYGYKMTFIVSEDKYLKKKKNSVAIYNKDYSSCSTIENFQIQIRGKESDFMPR